eukprot:503318_1
MSICDIFDRIRNQCIECDKLGFDTKYFINRMDELLKEINKTKCEIKVEDIIEKEELDYACVFNLLNEVSETLHKSSDFMKIIRQVIHKQQMNAWDFSDAVIKFHFTGVRVTEHERCKEGEALEYCIFCCGEPIYPEDGKGNVITGRIVDINNIHKNEQEFHSFKVSLYQHFVKNEQHWANITGGKKHKENNIIIQRNRFLEVLRMCHANVADAQFPKNCLKNHRINPGCMGNIGLSDKMPAKYRRFMADKIQKDIGDKITYPTAATGLGTPFSCSWDKSLINKKNLEPGIIKKRKNGYFQIFPIKITYIDHVKYFGTGKSLAMNKEECLLFWLCLTLLDSRRYCTSFNTDRQYFDLHVDDLLDNAMDWPSLFQAINDLCHQYELALNVIVQNNALEWTHNELTKIMLHPLANGSLRWDDCKSLMGKVFLTMRSVKEVKFHAHKRLNYRAMDNNIIALRFLYEKDMKDHPPRNIDKPSIPYKAWDLQAALLSSVQTVALNKLEVSFYEKIDCISINYQSPNHPWHAMKAETATVCFYYNDVNDVFSDYMEYLNDVTNEKFIKNKYLFSNEILDIFPNLKSIYMTD